MYTLLTLFFISLAIIILMIGRKVMLVRIGYLVVPESLPHPFIEDIDKVKYSALRGSKKVLHMGTFMIVRVYVKISNFIKKGYQNIKIKAQRFYHGNSMDSLSSQKEVNKFLRVVTDYKKKISAIKSRIDQEEERQ